MVHTDSKKSLVIQNGFIVREFSIDRKRLSTACIVNLRTGRTFIPAENSEEFCISFACFPKKVIECSSLKIDQIKTFEKDEVSTALIQFKPVKIKGCPAVICLEISLADDDFYIRKSLTVRFEDEIPDIKLDSVSFDCLNLDPLISRFAVPAQENCDISGFQMSLGQPVYVDSLFFGCEYPVCVNTVNDNKLRLSVYSGKSLSEAVTDKGFTSVSAVCGACRGMSESALTESFFDYIEKISLPRRFRRQYNSWYDCMTDITEEKLRHSFFEIEKGCTRYGMKPLDCFAVDDGWNDYDASFWTFNGKFPDGMFPVSRVASLFGSSLGLWLGPRGGYNLKTIPFAKRMEQAGKGHYNKKSHDICVASSTYTENVKAFLLDAVEKYDLNYLKLDGFSKKPCKDDSHGHRTGGKDNLYYYTDLCEKWIGILSDLRQKRAESGKDIWINLTCYVSPSPWLLKWADSVWIQNSADCSGIHTADDGTKLAGSDKDKLLTYRDSRYYDFYKVRKLQFPPARLYNHEPVYGKTAKISMTDEEFSEYLFVNACRGTSFWELYYSYEMMSEKKWAYSAAVLQWAERHAEVLSRSRMTGGSPSAGSVYGYTCFSGKDGVIVLRNPTQKEASYTLFLDEELGVCSDFSAVPCRDAMNGSYYGDVSYKGNMEVKLLPHEMKAFVFGNVKPLEVPSEPAPPRKLSETEHLSGECPFTVKAFVSPDTKGTLFSHNGEAELTADENGFLCFAVNGVTVQSTVKVSECAAVAAVREPNGMLKLYVDGELNASQYAGELFALSDTPHTTESTKVSVYLGAVPFDLILS